MAQPAKAQEPTMEEILASIRRIIADDDAAKPQPKPAPPAKPAEPVAKAPPAPAPADESMGQDDIDAMLSAVDDDLDDTTSALETAADVLELTEAMAAPQPESRTPTFRKIDPEQDVAFDEPPAAPSAPPKPPIQRAEASSAHAGISEPPLLSPAATAVVNSAFGTLAHNMMVQNAKTLEDLVKEMLRPLLKAWLDDNLPTLVERLVRAEIERVSRGRPG